MFDTVKGGDYLVDQDAAEIMCREAIDAVLELEHMGLPFNRTPDGKIDQRRFGGHTRNYGEAPVRRSCFAADRTGHMILQTLYQQCIKHGRRSSSTSTTCSTCCSADGRAAGRRRLRAGHRRAAHLPRQGGGVRHRRVRPGVPDHLQRALADRRRLGDRYRRGVPLEDMEFFQFHPTGLYGLGILLSEAARGEGGILRNSDGERFMERYAPTLKDLAPRDMVARVIYRRSARAAAAGPTGTTSTST